MTLLEFITWLGTSTGATVALSFLTERWPYFQTLSPLAKKVTHVLGASLLAVLVLLAQAYLIPLIPAETLTLLGNLFLVVAGIIGPYLAGQGFHAIDPARRDPQP